VQLSFPTLLSILLFGLGIILILSAIQPFTTTLGIVVASLGVIGILLAVIRNKTQ